MKNHALIVVDMQLDFCEGGSLAVDGGNAIAEDIANYIRIVGSAYKPIVFTKDWHQPLPSDNGGHFGFPPDFVDTWPVHCVQGSAGAEFHPHIKDIAWDYPLEHVFYKGDGRPDYSGFQGFNRQGQSLADFLREQDVKYVDVAGLAGDYCVKHTALDAVREGFSVTYLSGLTASVGGHSATSHAIIELEHLKRDLA